jgi:hypothetical protein
MTANLNPASERLRRAPSAAAETDSEGQLPHLTA